MSNQNQTTEATRSEAIGRRDSQPTPLRSRMQVKPSDPGYDQHVLAHIKTKLVVDPISHTESTSREFTLEAFGAWLRSQPADAAYCPPDQMRSMTCPLARFSGAQCCPDLVGFSPMPRWAARFMQYFDDSMRHGKPATQSQALIALESTERDFLPDEEQRS